MNSARAATACHYLDANAIRDYSYPVSTSPLGDRTPPDDTGSATFARYRYQAHVAFSDCLRCALLDEVSVVVLEHFEDIALELPDDCLELIQVKSRQAGRGPWTLGDLLGPSGPLKSLLRTHRALRGLCPQVALIARLEGPLKSGDDANLLLGGVEHIPAPVLTRCRQSLELSEAECEQFLRQTRVVPDLPSVRDIAATNIRKLGLAHPNARAAEIEACYSRVLARIESAMDGSALGEAWPSCLRSSAPLSTDMAARLEAKTLTKDILTPLLAPLGATSHILLKTVVIPVQATSPLQDKLLAAGAPESVCNDAKLLRAAYAQESLRLLSASLDNVSAQLEDVEERALMVGRAIASRHADDPAPGARIWPDVMHELRAQYGDVDRAGLFAGDSKLLLGALCERSARCDFGWRTPRET